MYINLSEEEDGVGKITASNNEMDHRLEIIKHETLASLEYHESCGPRGEIIVSEPPQDIFKEVIQSEKVTGFLNRHDLRGVAIDRSL